MLGILGGMGPLSSAEFLKTVYEYSSFVSRVEQETPAVIVYSDPSFPDRTEAFLRGEDDKILDKLVPTLRRMQEIGATTIVTCCVTIHYLYPRLPDDIRRSLVSVIDVIYDTLLERRGKHLMLCSTGSRNINLFERHPDWDRVKDFVLFLDDNHQDRLHELIYQMKHNRSNDEMTAFLESLLPIYGVDSFIVGCSEIHMVAKRDQESGSAFNENCWIDPFASIARKFTEDTL